MDSNWVLQRRLMLYSFIVIIIGLCMMYAYYVYKVKTSPAPSCTDGIMNQNEGGIDCEGECGYICKEHYKPLTVLYTKAIRTATSTYDIVSVLENVNLGKSPGELSYIIHVYSKDNPSEEVYTYKGKMKVKDGSKMPIIIPNITINREPGIANMELPEYKMYPVYPHQDIVELKDYRFENDNTRLAVNLRNRTLYASGKLKISAIIYVDDTAIDSGFTIDNGLDSKSEKTVYISWLDPVSLKSNYRVEIYIDYNE